jgi:hypothetical protein
MSPGVVCCRARGVNVDVDFIVIWLLNRGINAACKVQWYVTRFPPISLSIHIDSIMQQKIRYQQHHLIDDGESIINSVVAAEFTQSILFFYLFVGSTASFQ